MTFSTEKNKLFKLWNDSISNEFKIIRNKERNSIILDKLRTLNHKEQVINKPLNLSSDWLNFDSQLSGDNPFRLFKEFSIEINRIHESLIPYIHTKISYRLGDSNPSAPVPVSQTDPTVLFDEDATFKLNDGVQIFEVSTSIKRIIYKSSIFLENGDGLPSNLQVQFYFYFINAFNYQST